MGLGKTYSTRYLADSNNNTGVAGQVLISTATGIDWSDGSDIIGGPYLPLSAGVNFPLTGALYGGDAFFSGYIKFGGYSYIGEDLTETDSLTIASDNTESIFFAHYYPATSTYTTTMEISPSGELKMPMAADGDKLTVQSSLTPFNNIIEIGQTGSDGYLDVSAAGGGIVTHLSGYTGYASYFLSNVGIGNTTVGTKLDISGSSNGVSVRVKGDMGTGTYYYGYMFDGTNLKGTTQTNIFYAGASIAADTTIADYAGLRIDAPNVTASNAVITNNYGIYQASNLQKNYFAGNVGIGVTGPSVQLEVAESATIGAGSVSTSTTNWENVLKVKGKNNWSDGTTWYGDYGQILLSADSNMTGSAHQFLITNALNNNSFAIIRSVDANTVPVVNSTDTGVNSGTADFVIDTTGKVGIGNETPAARLTIGSAQGKTLDFSYSTNNGYVNNISNYWNSSTDTRMDFNIGPTANTAPTTIMTVGYAGNVGVKIIAPLLPLHVYAPDAGGNIRLTRDGTTEYHDIGTYYSYTNGNSADFGTTSAHKTFLTTRTYNALEINSDQEVSLLGYRGADGFALPQDENTGYSNFSAGGFGILFREAKDNYILGNAYYYKTGGAADWKAKYASGATMISSNVGEITFQTATSVAAGATLTFDPKMIIKNDGKVGIGTTGPTTTLSVQGSASNGINIIGVGTTATRCYLGLNSANKGYLFIAGSSGENPAVITSQGDSYISTNLGLGRTNPAVPLDVEGKIRSNDDSSNDYFEIFCDGSGSGDSYIENTSNNIQIKSAYATSFSTSGSVAMFIDYNQNVGIGTITPASKLEVSGRISGGQLGNPKITRQGLGLYVDFNDKACISGESGTEKPIDLGPSNYDLTLHEGANFEYLNGIGTFYFDGYNDYIEVNNFNVADTSNTYEIWHYAASQNGWETWWDSGNERPLLGTNGSNLRAYPNGTNFGTIDIGKWYHVVWAFASDTDLDIYINGDRVAEAVNWGNNQRTGTFTAWLGGDSAAETTDGYIAIARTYTRQLTLDDVLQNYNAEIGMFAGVTPSLGIVQAGGNVGIGINEGIDANLRVDANSGVLTQEILKVKGGGSGGNFGFLVEANNGDDLFKVDTFTYNSFFPNGKVMVGGTSTPTGDLTVASPGNQFHLRASTAAAGKYWNFDVTSANQLYIINNGGGQYITIKDNGFVGINDSTPTNVLDVDGDIRGTAYKLRGNVANPTDTAATIYDQSTVGLTLSAHNISFRNYNGTAMMESARFIHSSLTVAGDVIAYGSPSDVRLKENIKPIESALDKAMKLQGVTFDWKQKEDSILELKEDIGFIAQDVQKVVPELVRENKDGMLSMRHQGIAPILLEAIKELKAEIDLLKSKPCTCNKCNCNI
jgi:hypothetical protein